MVMDNQNISTNRGSVTYPGQLAQISNTINAISNIVLNNGKVLLELRRMFRGEAMFQTKEGENFWMQVSKPTFFRVDQLTQKPMMQEILHPVTKKKVKVYIPNDEAIDEILSELQFMGINAITPLTNLSDDNILDDLREFEIKLAGLLAQKQKLWGLDKQLLPMIQSKIKTIVQDVRYMACEGGTIKAMQSTIQRMEHIYEGEKNGKRMGVSPYS